MPLSHSDLSALSRLLDEVLDLAPAQLESWFAARPDARGPLMTRLRAMLAEHESPVGCPIGEPRLPPPADDASAHAEDLIGPYRLIHVIGRGGMGTVWLADRADGSLKRQVALKLPRLAWGAGLAERMLRERDIGALLEHPHIARLYDAGVDERGRPYLAFEYIDGQPLDRWCAAQALDVPERLRLLVQVVRAVAYAHGRLVVHRDLKPSNVLVTDDGQAHLLDFGIAKLLYGTAPGEAQLTQEQGRVLTPHYASPEQLRGETITVASDVYSLGVLAYELLTGQYPYAPARKSLAALEDAILHNEPPLASSRVSDRASAKALHGEIDAILAKALRREPAQRYATADALAEDIERQLNGDTVLARPDGWRYRLSKALRRRRWFWRHRIGFAVGGTLFAAALAVVSVVLVLQVRRADAAAEHARLVKEFIVDVFKVNTRGNPAHNELRRLPAEMLLEHGAKLIATKFAGQPELQSELYGVVAAIFLDLGAIELAVEYASRHVDALAAADASGSEQAQATMLLARSLLAQGRLSDAGLRAQRALALSAPYTELRTNALVLLAIVLRAQGKNEEALRMLDRAEQGLNEKTARTVTGALAKASRAALLSAANRFDEALPMYLSAIDEALAAEGDLSAAAVDIRLAFADDLLVLNRVEESRGHRNAALAALRTTGEVGEIRAALVESLHALVMVMRGLMPFVEAKTVIERSRSTMNARGRLVPESIRAWIDFELGYAYLIWGNIAQADAMISSSAATLRPTLEYQNDLYFLSGAQGMVAMYAGRHEQADELMREGLAYSKLTGNDKHPLTALEYAAVALNLVKQSRFDEAQAVLETAPEFATVEGAGGPPMIYKHVIQRAWARVKLQRGDAASAHKALPPADTDDAHPQASVSDRLLRGEILCALGERAQGLPLMNEYLKFHEKVDYEHNPDLARTRAAAGLCALADGQRKYATDLAALAHASLEAQPGVSPYYKAPSERLDRLLNQSAARR